MGKLYEINQQLDELFAFEWSDEFQAFVYPETGEFYDEEAFQQHMADLQLAKDEILQWMAKKILNDRSDIEALKQEEKRLADRRKSIERRVDRFMAILDRECGGEKKDLGVATVSYRASHPLEFNKENIPDIIAWLEENDHDDCLKYADPELRKTEITKLIKSGESVPFCEIGNKQNMSLK